MTDDWMKKLWEVALVKRRFGPDTEHTCALVKAKYLCSRHILTCLSASRTQSIFFQKNLLEILKLS